ncbi:MAG: hypothetical protein Ct9H300mP12_07030 [Acidimicrobiales bacterium]|nr:MAG: hypothetical protein Ct9H300mP12_07030 [Acidimicrobiales bacterium]
MAHFRHGLVLPMRERVRTRGWDCVECGVALVSEPPADPAEVGASDEDQLAYELHEWAGESRRILDQDLTAAGVAHAWQGPLWWCGPMTRRP